MVTLWGGIAAAVMVSAYALEGRSAWWVAVFAVGCVGAAGYAVAVEAWPFAVLEGVWSVVAVRRWRGMRAGEVARTRHAALEPGREGSSR